MTYEMSLGPALNDRKGFGPGTFWDGAVGRKETTSERCFTALIICWL